MNAILVCALLFAVQDAPEGRNHHTVVGDGDRVIVVAGWTVGGPLKDAWILNREDHSWKELPSPIQGWGHSAVRDDRRMLLFGGNHSGQSRNDLWSLDLESLKWEKLETKGEKPEGRLYHRAVVDRKRNRMLVVSGLRGYGKGRHDDLWSLDLKTLEWMKLTPKGEGPGARNSFVAVADPARDRMILFAGQKKKGGYESDTWSLDLASLEWSKLRTGGSEPGPRAYLHGVRDAKEDRMLIFGGGKKADVWSLDLETHEWKELVPDGRGPAKKMDPAVAYDAGAHQLILVGGWEGDGPVTDCWTLDLATLKWTCDAPAPKVADLGLTFDMKFRGPGARVSGGEGLKIGDVVLQVDGKKVGSQYALFAMLRGMKSGRTLKLVVQRGRESREVGFRIP